MLMASIHCPDFDQPGLCRPHQPCQLDYGGPCFACSKLNVLESKIYEAKRVFEDLMEQHRHAKTEMNRSHNPLILQLPQEIASLTFRHCFPPVTLPSGSSEILPEGYQQHVSARLILGAVCREWRRIAWTTPRLWTELAVRLDSALPWNPDFIQEWLSRSGVLPLSISVSGSSSWRQEGPNALSILDILNRVSDRWHILRLKDVRSEYFSLLRGNPSSRSILQALSLNQAHAGDTDSHENFRFENTNSAPSHIALSNVSFKVLPISWKAVTWIKFTRRPVIEFLKLLRLASDVRTLTLDLTSLHLSQTSVVGTVTHEHLKELHIEDFIPSEVERLLNNLVLPELMKLTITNDMAPLPTGSLRSFLQRSACQLKGLTINGTEYRSNDILSLLGAVPTLERLELAPLISLDNLADDLFTRLVQTALSMPSQIDGENDEYKTFLPQLQSFTYNIGMKYYLHEDKVFPWRLVPSLFGPITSEPNACHRRPLEHVTIYIEPWRGSYSPAMDEACYPEFTAVLRTGSNLNVEYSDHSRDLLEDIRQLIKEEGAKRKEIC